MHIITGEEAKIKLLLWKTRLNNNEAGFFEEDSRYVVFVNTSKGQFYTDEVDTVKQCFKFIKKHYD